MTQTDNTDRHGKTIAFVSARGGTGTTTVATNVAVAIAHYSRARTTFLDLNLGRTIADQLLDLPADGVGTVSDLLPVLSELGSELPSRDVLSQAQVAHATGLQVMIASRDVEVPIVPDELIHQLVKGVAATSDVVIVDVASVFDGPAMAALAAADRVLVVATPDVPTLKRTKALVQRLRALKPETAAVRVVLNEANGSSELTLQQIEAFLGEPAWSVLPSAAAESRKYHDRRQVPVLDLGGPFGKALYLTALKLHPMKRLAKPK